MKTIIDFTKTIMLLPKPWLVFVGLLVGANMVGSLLYINSLEGKVVLTAMMFGAITQMALFRAKGFVRLLGIGHIFWIPLVPWLWARLEQVEPGDPLAYWMVALVLANSLSTILDAVDVFRYVRGER